MKSISSTSVAAAALPVLAAADGAFWSGAPSCAQSCVSSAFSSSSNWPSPTAFCGTDGPAIASCFSAHCGTATASVVSSFSSISSSLCSLYSSCSAAGSTGVVTVTATGGSWGGFSGGGHSGGGWGRDGDGSHSGPWGASGTNWPSNGATTTFTVSGCGAFVTGGGWNGWGGHGGHGGQGGNGDGDGWGGGSWGGDGVWGGHGGFWGTSQKGWAYRTATTPLTTTFSTQGAFVTATGIATVEEAVSGSHTSTTTFFALNAEASSTGTSSGSGSSPSTSGSSSNSAAGNEGWAGVKIAGLALGTLLVVVGML